MGTIPRRPGCAGQLGSAGPAEVRMVESLGFLGVRTDALDATVALCRDVLPAS